MVFLVEGVTLDEAPQSVAQLYLQFGQLREAARHHALTVNTSPVAAGHAYAPAGKEDIE